MGGVEHSVDITHVDLDPGRIVRDRPLAVSSWLPALCATSSTGGRTTGVDPE